MKQGETEDSDDEDTLSSGFDEGLEINTASATPDVFNDNETEDNKGEAFLTIMCIEFRAIELIYFFILNG